MRPPKSEGLRWSCSFILFFSPKVRYSKETFSVIKSLLVWKWRIIWAATEVIHYLKTFSYKDNLFLKIWSFYIHETLTVVLYVDEFHNKKTCFNLYVQPHYLVMTCTVCLRKDTVDTNTHLNSRTNWFDLLWLKVKCHYDLREYHNSRLQTDVT